jgi:ABC-type transport system involved in multi-copper enzyme maturation permease subunit
MSARRIALVAVHVFKENVRDRVLYAIGAFALLMVAVSVAIGQITAGEDVKIIKDLGLTTIELAGLLMTVFIGVGLVSREIDRRSIFALLAKPVARWEFVLGKYVGLVLTIVVNVAAMTAALYLVLAYLDLSALPIERRAWDAPATDPRLLIAVLLITLELALLTAISLLFSTFSSSGLLSMTLTLGVYVVGVFSADFRAYGEIVDAPLLAPLVVAIGWIAPAFSAFDVKGAVVHGHHISAGFVWSTIGYATLYVAAALAAAVTIFSRRDFK